MAIAAVILGLIVIIVAGAVIMAHLDSDLRSKSKRRRK